MSKLYLKNTYQFQFDSFITHIDEDQKGLYLILNETAFYPQGGGQPSDQGFISCHDFNVQVIHVLQVGEEIRHYISPTQSALQAGIKIQGLVNEHNRMLNARYHTAAHLLSNVVEIQKPFLKAVKGHSFPGQAYVEFHALSDDNNNQATDNVSDFSDLQSAIKKLILQNKEVKIFEMTACDFENSFYKLPYDVPSHKQFRIMQIGDMMPVPCGGTHLAFLGEIGKMQIKKIKMKNSVVKISYEVV